MSKLQYFAQLNNMYIVHYYALFFKKINKYFEFFRNSFYTIEKLGNKK